MFRRVVRGPAARRWAILEWCFAGLYAPRRTEGSKKREDRSREREAGRQASPQRLVIGLTGEPLAELNKTVTPVTSAVQWTLKNLDSGSRTGHFRDRPHRNDVEGLLQEAQD